MVKSSISLISYHKLATILHTKYVIHLHNIWIHRTIHSIFKLFWSSNDSLTFFVAWSKFCYNAVFFSTEYLSKQHCDKRSIECNRIQWYCQHGSLCAVQFEECRHVYKKCLQGFQTFQDRRRWIQNQHITYPQCHRDERVDTIHCCCSQETNNAIKKF